MNVAKGSKFFVTYEKIKIFRIYKYIVPFPKVWFVLGSAAVARFEPRAAPTSEHSFQNSSSSAKDTNTGKGISSSHHRIASAFEMSAWATLTIAEADKISARAPCSHRLLSNG